MGLFPSDDEPIVIGVDESGTGAWAGPFMVAAVALGKWVGLPGVTDSKKLSDATRRRLVVDIEHAARAYHVETVPVKDIRHIGQSQCWVVAVETCIRKVIDELDVLDDVVAGRIRVVVDGPHNKKLAQRLGNIKVDFIPKADSLYLSVGAASILAKTARNDAMIELSKKYQGYGWERNAGYGTAEHEAKLHKNGVTLEHRLVRPVRECKKKSKVDY